MRCVCGRIPHMPSDRSYLGSASSSYAQAVLDYFEERGLDPAAAFGAPLVRSIREAPAGHRLSTSQWLDMLQRAGRHLDDPAFPLKLAATIKQRHLGMLGFLLMSCDTLGAAALTLQRYEHLLDSVNAAEFQVHGDHCTLAWRPLVENPPVELATSAMALWVHKARWLAERPDLVCGADFTQPEPHRADVRACFDETFGGTVRFGQPLDRLVIPVAYVGLPVAQRDRHVHESLCRQAEADLVQLLGQDHGFLEHLEALLAVRLESGEVTLQHVAQALTLAPRTLQARLDEHGVTYRELLDRVRRRQAERHLRDPAIPLSAVAAMLGFSDQSGFQHAFKRWTGDSPGAWRRRFFGGPVPRG
ncbi:MAG: AraC family transcriptional regulator [Aquabacterium sp.]|nr:MAG: AraC family transcriptional regulator [Aquabacterium sp.]